MLIKKFIYLIFHCYYFCNKLLNYSFFFLVNLVGTGVKVMEWFKVTQQQKYLYYKT